MAGDRTTARAITSLFNMRRSFSDDRLRPSSRTRRLQVSSRAARSRRRRRESGPHATGRAAGRTGLRRISTRPEARDGVRDAGRRSTVGESAEKRAFPARPRRRPGRHGPCSVGIHAAPAMPMTVRHERENVYRVEVQGLLRSSEFEQCQDVLRAEIDRVGPRAAAVRPRRVRGLGAERRLAGPVVLRHPRRPIERIAIVGDERWRSETLMFASADLRKGPVEFFSPEQIAGARYWLSA